MDHQWTDLASATDTYSNYRRIAVDAVSTVYSTIMDKLLEPLNVDHDFSDAPSGDDRAGAEPRIFSRTGHGGAPIVYEEGARTAIEYPVMPFVATMYTQTAESICQTWAASGG